MLHEIAHIIIKRFLLVFLVFWMVLVIAAIFTVSRKTLFKATTGVIITDETLQANTFNILNDSLLIDNIMQSAREFNIHDIREDRDFETYSGGQKAIIACLLTLALIRDRKINGLKLLLNNILDSISEKNRSKLLQLFKEICLPRNIRLFTEKNGNIQEIN